MGVRKGIRRGTAFTRAVRAGFLDYDRQKRTLRRELDLRERAEWLHKLCSGALRSLDISVDVIGTVPNQGLIVSNHLSYVDILCFSSAAASVFVSKSDVKSWPLFGKLATKAGTIYIDRRRSSDAHRVSTQMEDALRDGLRVVLFPEGTSSDGRGVLRFHAPLFESAVRAAAPITPACIVYEVEDGDPSRDVAYWGDMTFGPHFLKLLGKGRVHAKIYFGETRHGLTDRKTAAETLREDVIALHTKSNQKYPH